MWASVIVHFKRLGSQGFHDLLNHYLCFFNEYCKTEVLDIRVNFSRFFKRCSDDFHKYKMSIIIMRKNL